MRRGAAGPAGGRVVRAPNHLGDVVMALPGLRDAGADVMVLERLAPVLDMAGLPVRVLPLRRGVRGFLDAAGRLRRGRYAEGVLLTPSLGAALLFRTGGVARLRGTATDGRTPLLADPVPREALGRRHRVLQYRFLLGLDPAGPADTLTVPPPAAARDRWSRRLALDGAGAPVALFPGSNAPARRWPPERFAELGRRFASRGRPVLVLGGQGERPLTADVAAGVPGATDLGGRTDLPDLAAILSLAGALVTNDTGPMHLAGLVGTPTVTVWGSSDPEEVRPLGAPHFPVTLEEPLSCMPCRKNRCPRRGTGFRSPLADTECLRLVDVDRVEAALRRALGEEGPAPSPRPRAAERAAPSSRKALP